MKISIKVEYFDQRNVAVRTNCKNNNFHPITNRVLKNTSLYGIFLHDANNQS